MHPTLSTALELIRAGRAGEARELIQRQLRSRPRDADLHHALGRILLAAGEVARAEFHLGQAAGLAAPPGDADFLVGHGVALGRLGKAAEAERAYRRAAAVEPGSFEAWIGVSHAAAAQHRFWAGAEAARRAVELDPQNPHAVINLTVCLRALGRGREAVEALRAGLERMPEQPPPLLLLTQYAAELNYVSGVSDEELMAAHERLGRVLEATQGGAGMAEPRPPDPDPERRLRVAYLSPDFRAHSVSSFVEPILRGHDREGFEVVCVSTTGAPDETTERLWGLADTWVNGAGLGDEELARKIERVAPDILVDLAGHTSESRVRVMARRLAPVQVSMIGYPNTTGIGAMDARIVDGVTDPVGAERWATERLVRIDPCFLCYRAPEEALEPKHEVQSTKHKPEGAGSGVVFASFNIISKVSEACLDAWGAILRGSPGATLRLKSACFGETAAREDWAARFAARGVEAARLDLRPYAPSYREHLASYDGVSIALDTFPYNGTTTTCEALAMGVPVVAFAGERHAGRVSGSLLAAAGVPELVADSVEGYVRLATALASDAARLEGLRAGLGARVRASALCDGKAYVARLEAAFRSLWRERCARG